MTNHIDFEAVAAAIQAIDYDAIYRLIDELGRNDDSPRAVEQHTNDARTTAGTTPRPIATLSRHAHADLIAVAA
jgi:hypothetical protein